MGASGAIFGVLGAFAMSYPNSGIGVVFVPGFSLPASQAMIGLALFETYGLVKGFKSLPWAHGAHLGGLLFGAAYVYFDGKTYIWTPARRFAFTQMQRLGLT